MKRATSRKDSAKSRRRISRGRKGRGLAKIRSFASEHLNPMCVYGYARVSTSGQELDIQLAQLEAAGCKRVFCEKESGTKDNRRVLSQLLRRLRPGDVVIVSALDRLTRGGPFKMLSTLAEITSRGAAYKTLAEPWADTTHELGEVLAALVGYIARKTREDIIRRTSAGRERARQNGVRFGRKPKLSMAQRQAALARRLAGEEQKAIAKAYNVSCSTISRLKPVDTTG
ncbi:DNA invertase Pin-like site-specific DNA recombinase [Bradyrhizobium sp. LA6.10]|uniref:recombinase family protein n=1 Tax=Bradyrhizobium sp. LA6.10 TaxID=3156318 RepID=UPI003390BB5F